MSHRNPVTNTCCLEHPAVPEGGQLRTKGGCITSPQLEGLAGGRTKRVSTAVPKRESRESDRGIKEFLLFISTCT